MYLNKFIILQKKGDVSMKKRLLLLIFALALTSAMPVFAMPKQMADGIVFDAEYYRKNNPDVVAVLGRKCFIHSLYFVWKK